MRCGGPLLKYEKTLWSKPTLYERKDADWMLVDCVSPIYLDAGVICVGSVTMSKWEAEPLSEEQFSTFKNRCENGLSMHPFPLGDSQCKDYLKTGEIPTRISITKIEAKAKVIYDFIDKSITTVSKDWLHKETTNVVKCTKP